MRRTRSNVPSGFDSWLEYDLAQVLDAEYHSCKVPYVQYKNYEPDFIIHDGITTIYIEAKGRFRDKEEARKYRDVGKGLAPTEELVFIFQNPKLAMPAAKRRSDGTRFTHADWAEKWNFRYYSADDLPQEWIK